MKNVKKYIVTKDIIIHCNDLHIYEVKTYTDKSIKFTAKNIHLKYIYLIEEDELLDMSHVKIMEEYDEHKIKQNILYTSNSMKDIKINLPLLNAANNYNL